MAALRILRNSFGAKMASFGNDSQAETKPCGHSASAVTQAASTGGFQSTISSATHPASTSALQGPQQHNLECASGCLQTRIYPAGMMALAVIVCVAATPLNVVPY